MKKYFKQQTHTLYSGVLKLAPRALVVYQEVPNEDPLDGLLFGAN